MLLYFIFYLMLFHSYFVILLHTSVITKDFILLRNNVITKNFTALHNNAMLL